MTHWIIPSNNSHFRLDDYLRDFNEIVWHHRSNFEPGDIIYIYATAPQKRITYKLVVTRVNISPEEYETKFNDSAYFVDPNLVSITNDKRSLFKLISVVPKQAKLSLSDLKQHGCKSSMQSSVKVQGELLNYIEAVLNSNIQNNDCEIDYPNKDDAFYEGAVTKVLANRYERNPKARQQCIEKLGCKCIVCGCDFSERYGELGEGFIHVHHIVLIGSIGKEYVLDPIKDLVPICPNCHYMLHRSNPPMKPEELKKLLHHD